MTLTIKEVAGLLEGSEVLTGAAVKAAGGIRDYKSAKMMIEAGANRLGTTRWQKGRNV